MEEERQETIQKEEAATYLKESREASNPVSGVTSQWKVMPEDRECVTSAIISAVDTEIHARVAPPTKFPSDKPNDSVWTRTFYRFVDSEHCSQEVRECEARIFHQVTIFTSDHVVSSCFMRSRLSSQI